MNWRGQVGKWGLAALMLVAIGALVFVASYVVYEALHSPGVSS